MQKPESQKIVIERTLKLITITINTARPGIIIGKGGQEVDKLKEELKKITDKEVQINIFEIKRPELDAVIVGNNIARQLEGRVAYRRAIKMAIASTMRMGAEGIKIFNFRTSERRLKWLVLRCSRREELRCIHSVPILIMHRQKP